MWNSGKTTKYFVVPLLVFTVSFINFDYVQHGVYKEYVRMSKSHRHCLRRLFPLSNSNRLILHVRHWTSVVLSVMLRTSWPGKAGFGSHNFSLVPECVIYYYNHCQHCKRAVEVLTCIFSTNRFSWTWSQLYMVLGKVLSCAHVCSWQNAYHAILC